MNDLFADKWIRGRAMRSKWRRLSTISMEAIEDHAIDVRKFIREGYKYNNGFKAIGHVAGVSRDDFVRNQIAVIFFLMKVPRICRRLRR